MDVILLERVERLGQMGDVVGVRPGFARNFLLPKGKALRATKANKSYFEQQKAQIEAQNLKRKDEAAALAEKIDGLSVVLIRQASEGGQLYGSVTTRDIAEAVTAAGFTVSRQQVRLDRAIKTLGLFDLTLQLYAEVKVSVELNIARTAEEAVMQKESGKALTGLRDDDEDVAQDDLAPGEMPDMEVFFEPEAEVANDELAIAAVAESGVSEDIATEESDEEAPQA